MFPPYFNSLKKLLDLQRVEDYTFFNPLKETS